MLLLDQESSSRSSGALMKRTTPALQFWDLCDSANAAMPWYEFPVSLGGPWRVIICVTLMRPWLSIVTCNAADKSIGLTPYE